MTTQATTCEGHWGNPRPLGESEPFIYVHKCTGCGDLLVIRGYRGYDVPAGSSDEDILRAVLVP